MDTFLADVLADNHEVLGLIAGLGLPVHYHRDGCQTRCVIRLASDERYAEAVGERDRRADVASLDPLLRPRSLAPVGAGRSSGSVGRAAASHTATATATATATVTRLCRGTVPSTRNVP